MNILLLIPPASLNSSYGQLKDFSNPQPSIGLAYIAAVLRKNGISVTVLDAYVNQLGIEEILAEIKSRKIDILGISLLTTSVVVTTLIIKEVRAQLPEVKIVLGNVHASLFGDDLLRDHLADFIIHREGEYTFGELAKALKDNTDIQKVKGLSFRKDGQIVHTEPRPLIEDLDELPFPAWDLFPLENYHSDPRTEVFPGETEMQLLTTRGCPNACTFCSSRTERNMGMKYRMRSAKNIADEIQYMHEHFQTRVFGCMDLAFPLVKKHAMSLFDEIIKRGLGKKIAWMTECRVKPLDYETLTRMKEAGCVRINFGFESGNNRILELLKKNFTTEDAEKAVDMARRAGIEVDGMFMIGLPTETEDEIKQTIDFAVKLKVRYAIFNIFVPYPGCELYDTLTAEDKIKFNSWSDFTSYPTYSGGIPVYVPDGLTHEGLMNLQKYAMRKFYLSPNFIIGEIKRFKFSKIIQYYHGLKGVVFG